MRWNDGILGDFWFLGQPAATFENRALRQHATLPYASVAIEGNRFVNEAVNRRV